MAKTNKMEIQTNQKAFTITNKLIDNTKYLYTDWILGIYQTLVEHYRQPNDDSTVFGMIEAIQDYFWSGIEPDWASIEACEWWTNMDSSYFNIYDNNQRKIDLNFYYGSDLERLKTAKPDMKIEWSEGKVPPKVLIVI